MYYNVLYLIFLYYLGYCGRNLPLIFHFMMVITICGLSYISGEVWPACKTLSPRPWVLYPDIQRADWVNKIIAAVWPLSLNEMQRFLQELSDCISCHYFYPGVKIVLNRRGLNQPRVVGVKYHGVEERARIVTDFYLEYESDSLITIHLFTLWTFLRISLNVSRIELKTHLRLECELKTMQDSELLQRIQISALEVPEIDISFGLLTGLLGVDRVVKRLITGFFESYLMFPEKYEIFSNTRSTDHLLIPEGVLNIFVQEARGLLNKDLGLSARADPYVLISFSVDSRHQRFQTQTVRNSVNPQWKYMCQVPVEDPQTLSSLTFKVMDYDVMTADDDMGSTEMSVQQSELLGTPLQTWRRLYLEGEPAGKLKIMMSFSPCTVQQSSVARSRNQGVLTVFVDSCQNLSKLSNLHPYWRLKASVGKNVQLSRSVQMSSCPVFCEKFVFIVSELETDQVTISVHNVKNNKVGGLLRLRVSSLAQSGQTLSNLSKLVLSTKSPTGQKKDPKILLGFEYREVRHSSDINRLFPIHSKNKILRISEEKLFKNQVSILESSTVGVSKKTILLAIIINYDTNSSILRLQVKSISCLTTSENIVYLEIDLKRGNFKKKISNTLTIDTRQSGNIEKQCQYNVERNCIRASKLKVNSLLTKTVTDQTAVFILVQNKGGSEIKQEEECSSRGKFTSD